MAHQTDVHTVHQNFEPENPHEKVQDPYCGKELEKRASKFMVFRESGTYYFCSRDCEDGFLKPATSGQAA